MLHQRLEFGLTFIQKKMYHISMWYKWWLTYRYGGRISTHERPKTMINEGIAVAVLRYAVLAFNLGGILRLFLEFLKTACFEFWKKQNSIVINIRIYKNFMKNIHKCTWFCEISYWLVMKIIYTMCSFLTNPPFIWMKIWKGTTIYTWDRDQFTNIA